MAQPQRRAAVTWNRDGAIVEFVLDSPPANALGPRDHRGLARGDGLRRVGRGEGDYGDLRDRRLFRRGRRHQTHVVGRRGVVPGVRRRAARRAGTPRRPAHGLRRRHRRARPWRRSRVGDGMHAACRRCRSSARASRSQTRPDPRRRRYPTTAPSGWPWPRIGHHAHRAPGRSRRGVLDRAGRPLGRTRRNRAGGGMATGP